MCCRIWPSNASRCSGVGSSPAQAAARPATLYTVSVTRSASRSRVSLGSNPWRQSESRHNLAAMAERYGGGGHPVVTAISFAPDELDEARAAARTLAAELRR
jgi:hypothetical protein